MAGVAVNMGRRVAGVGVGGVGGYGRVESESQDNNTGGIMSFARKKLIGQHYS